MATQEDGAPTVSVGFALLPHVYSFSIRLPYHRPSSPQPLLVTDSITLTVAYTLITHISLIIIYLVYPRLI
jgi:hypothetical protein